MTDPAVIEKFCEKIYLSPTGCWLWTGYIDPKGYGIFSFRQGCKRTRLAHCFAYTEFYGPLPDRWTEVNHLCNERSCVFPLHLETTSKRGNAVYSAQCLRKRRKLWPEQVYEIRRLTASGVVYFVIAEMFRVSETVIGMIHRRQSWAWLPEKASSLIQAA